MEDGCVFAGLETRKNLLFLEVGFWEDQSMGLVAVGGNYDMVIDIFLSILEMQPYSSIIVVGYGFNRSVEENVIGRKALHDCVNITLRTVFESQPLWS